MKRLLALALLAVATLLATALVAAVVEGNKGQKAWRID